MRKIKAVIQQLKKAYQLLVKNDPLRLAAATAFFTSFALPPILMILIQLLSLLFNRRTISHKLFQHLSDLIGRESTVQLITTLRGFRSLADNWTTAILGFLFLGFVATTLFKVIQSSFNQLWMIRRTGTKKISMAFHGRAKSVLAILFTGLLFLATLFTESLQTLLGGYMSELAPGTRIFFTGILSILVSVLIVWIWFAMIFRYLADGRPCWKVAFTSALLTSLLFNAGKYVFKWLLINSNLGLLYGTSSSIVLLLLFVFYSSMILYFGAAFTKVWADHLDRPIVPMRNSVYYIESEPVNS